MTEKVVCLHLVRQITVRLATKMLLSVAVLL